jgi:colanic acid biosynthesis glycosyl transferase WcaI
LRILIASVNYAPEQTGIAPFSTGLAEHLAEHGHQVVVATTFPFAPLWRWYEPPRRWRTRETLNKVEVWRTKVVLPHRRTTAWRIIFDSSVGLATLLMVLSVRRFDITIYVSPPIQPALLGLALRAKLGKRVMLVQDLPTEAARSVGMLNGAPALQVARTMERVCYTSADHIVVISKAFSTHMKRLGIKAGNISEIPDWADLDLIRPVKSDHEIRLRLGAARGDFLIVYAGNMGAKQDLRNVVSAAALLKHESQIKFALIGDGQERQAIADQVAAQGLRNVKLLPLQPAAELSKVLSSSDALLINQAPLVVDSVLPSKLLTYMASGRPVLAAAHPDSTTASLVQHANCGVIAEPGRPEALASTIRSLASQAGRSGSLETMGRQGRAYVEEHFERTAVLNRWTELIDRLHPRPRSRV